MVASGDLRRVLRRCDAHHSMYPELWTRPICVRPLGMCDVNVDTPYLRQTPCLCGVNNKTPITFPTAKHFFHFSNSHSTLSLPLLRLRQTHPLTLDDALQASPATVDRPSPSVFGAYSDSFSVFDHSLSRFSHSSYRQLRRQSLQSSRRRCTPLSISFFLFLSLILAHSFFSLAAVDVRHVVAALCIFVATAAGKVSHVFFSISVLFFSKS